jgi:hypothetical protein
MNEEEKDGDQDIDYGNLQEDIDLTNQEGDSGDFKEDIDLNIHEDDSGVLQVDNDINIQEDDGYTTETYTDYDTDTDTDTDTDGEDNDKAIVDNEAQLNNDKEGKGKKKLCEKCLTPIKNKGFKSIKWDPENKIPCNVVFCSIKCIEDFHWKKYKYNKRKPKHKSRKNN